MRSFFWCTLLCVAITAMVAGAQQHSYTPADIENGSRLYQGSCVGCHGASGDGIPGIDLGRGQFRRAVTDSEIIYVIRSGIPGTTMPPSGFSEDQAAAIVAYLRSIATSAARSGTTDSAVGGNTGRGKALFEGKGACARCHRVNGVGPRLAPDLSDIGAVRNAADLQQKLVDPNALVRTGNRFVELTTKEGKTISGRLLNYDSFSIQLLDSDERLVSMPKSTLRDFRFLKTSTMPSYRDQLSGDEMTDLVGYLVSLKGPRP